MSGFASWRVVTHGSREGNEGRRAPVRRQAPCPHELSSERTRAGVPGNRVAGERRGGGGETQYWWQGAALGPPGWRPPGKSQAFASSLNLSQFSRPHVLMEEVGGSLERDPRTRGPCETPRRPPQRHQQLHNQERETPGHVGSLESIYECRFGSHHQRSHKALCGDS